MYTLACQFMARRRFGDTVEIVLAETLILIVGNCVMSTAYAKSYNFVGEDRCDSTRTEGRFEDDVITLNANSANDDAFEA